MSKQPLPASAEGLPNSEASQAYHREYVNPAEAAYVRTLDPKELMSLFDAAEAASEALTGIYNRPNCGDTIGSWIDQEQERLSDIRTYAMEQLQRLPMSGDKTDDEIRMGYVIAWDLKACGAGAMETLETLVRMKKDHDSAAFHARRKGEAA